MEDSKHLLHSRLKYRFLFKSKKEKKKEAQLSTCPCDTPEGPVEAFRLKGARSCNDF